MRILVLVLLIALGSGGCASGSKNLTPRRPWEKVFKGPSIREERFTSMGSPFVIRIWLTGAERAAPDRILEEARQSIEALHAKIDPESESSDVFRLQEAAGKDWVQVSPEVLELGQLAQQMWRRSDAMFNITYRPGVAPENQKGLDLEIDPPGKRMKLQTVITKINFFGMARGYAADRALARLARHGLAGYAVIAGGFVAAAGKATENPHLMCIENPKRLGTCGYVVKPARPGGVFYLGSSASLERKANIYNPNDFWKYRKGGVIVTGTSGVWVQYAATISAVMQDLVIGKFLMQGEPKLAAVFFQEVGTTDVTLSGRLEPFARVEEVKVAPRRKSAGS
ncbi:MAG: FAD:protein FMN transferase [Bdellovibrionales bacterium]|nr:FAD:protein FMN transferase [Bdellovibrionales bacterium]